MSTLALWRLFHRPGRSSTSGHTSALAIIAFAAATAIFLTVLGGVHGFVWRASADHTFGCMLNETVCQPGTLDVWRHRVDSPTDPASDASGYVMLAGFACTLLVVPFAALAGSAARLAASRRDARLAALRLAGATTGQVVRLTALDAAGQALVGSFIGVLGYCALMPLIMLLRFQNERFTFEQLWVGIPVLAATVAGVAVLALVSSLMTLRRVAITPLGVTSRVAGPLPSARRAVMFVLAMLVAVIIFKNPAMLARFGLGGVMLYAVVIGFVLLCFALFNLIGSWVVTARAKSKVRRPKDAATMIAMRRILDNPKRAWRNVSGIALAVFIAGITSICGFLGSAASAGSPNDPSTMFLRDIGTGGLLTLVFAAVLAAVSSGVMQAGSVYDQVNEYRMLVLEGTDVKTLNRARFIEVLTPLNVVVIVGGGCSMLLMAPLFALAMAQPATLLSFLGGLALCYALVAVGAFASNRVATNLNLTDYRADD
ncbi:ABC transporter permease [Bifidobacterium sp. 82T24]|uniref:FtsX-like permease family protein n=1 Tax=Bifidobacterium pluvialisilvae TaxID=2834436 RepID=UPI001C565598|nr:FtsX-like permease family protein [Bifidobacterium pluvialisilvae]MBW3088662.1 ABC transporter permease [Bifidobacterium pluvialisilvae]